MSFTTDSGAVDCASASCAKKLRRKVALSVVGALAVSIAMVVVLAGKRHEFASALGGAPLGLLAIAAGLQVVAIACRTEAWLTSINAAGGRVARRILFRSAGFGAMAGVINSSLGCAARIGSLRRSSPESTPKLPAMLAAEVPIVTVEIGLGALFSFTLIAPLGIPWWTPGVAMAIVAAIVFGLRRAADRNGTGIAAGLGVLRDRSRNRLVGCVILSILCQIARNWLMLHAIGIDVGPLDAIALLIAMFTLGQLPVGPSIGPAAATLILGAHGIADCAAAGVLLAVTGMIGSLAFTAWALTDHFAISRFVPRAKLLAAAPALD